MGARERVGDFLSPREREVDIEDAKTRSDAGHLLGSSERRRRANTGSRGRFSCHRRHSVGVTSLKFSDSVKMKGMESLTVDNAKRAPNTNQSRIQKDRGRSKSRWQGHQRGGSRAASYTEHLGGTASLDVGDTKKASNSNQSLSVKDRGRSQCRGRRPQRGAVRLSSVDSVRVNNAENLPPLIGGGSKKRGHCLDIEELENLLRLPSDIVILKLLNKRSRFCPPITRYDMSPKVIGLLVKVLSHCTSARSNKENMLELFSRICQQKFMTELSTHAFTITRRYPQEAADFFADLFIFLSSIADAMINVAVDKLPNSVEVLLSALKQLRQNDHISEEIIKKYSGLQEKLHEAIRKWGKENLNSEICCKGQADVNLLEPPDDFRDIPVLPTAVDITQTERPYFRKNIVQGKYMDGHHYLDVQYRLLREDFFQPLRKGIRDFRLTSKKIRDVRIYVGVTINEPVLKFKKVVHIVNLHLRKNYTPSPKQLMFGNLLCFSNDNFQTVFFGYVAERGTKFLREGNIGVQFESPAVCGNFSGKFVMVESQAFFVAYKHVLKALQETPDDAVPLEPYIVHVQCNVEMPSYITDTPIYDLRVLKDLKMMKKSETQSPAILRPRPEGVYAPQDDQLMHLREVPIRNDLDTWPSHKELGLDESQRRAVRNALTRKFALIQGPPGTGKTFIGLKIVQTLLHNSVVWKSRGHSTPILVVCYTNHALDQFLEGIASYTSSIVRVGSRTESKIISKFQICSLILSLRNDRSYKYKSGIPSLKYEVYQEMEGIEETIFKYIMMKKNCNANAGILCLDLFTNENIIPQHMLQQLISGGKFTSWLIGEELQKFFFTFNVLPRQVAADDVRLVEVEENPPTNPEELESDDVGELTRAEEHERMLDIDIDGEQPQQMPVSCPEQYEVSSFELDREISQLKRKCTFEILAYFRQEYLTDVKRILHQGLQVPENYDAMEQLEKVVQVDIWSLDFVTRWQLYKYWIRKLEAAADERVRELRTWYSQKSKVLEELRSQEQLFVMRHASVVGMTTTGAARCNSMLQDLAPAIGMCWPSCYKAGPTPDVQ